MVTWGQKDKPVDWGQEDAPIGVIDPEQEKRMENSLFYSQQLGVPPQDVFDIEPQLNAEMFGREDIPAQPGKMLKDAVIQSMSEKSAMVLRGSEIWTPGGALGIDALLDKSSTFIESLGDEQLQAKLQNVREGRLWPIAKNARWWQVESKYLPEVINAWSVNVGDQIPIALITLAGQQVGSLVGKPLGLAIGAGYAMATGGPDAHDVAAAPAIANSVQWVSKHIGGAAGLVGIEGAAFMDDAEHFGIPKDIAEENARLYSLGSGAIEYSQWLFRFLPYKRLARGVTSNILKETLVYIGGSAFEGVEEISQEGLERHLLRRAVKQTQERDPSFTADIPATFEGWKRTGAIAAVTGGIIKLPAAGLTMAQGRLQRARQVLPKELQTPEELGPEAEERARILEESIQEGVEAARAAPIPPETEIVAPEPTKAAPAVVAEVTEKKVKEPITKPERESLRDMGHTIPEIAAMEPKAARRLLNKTVNADAYTPPVVDKEIPTKKAELTEESKNAPTVLEHYWREYDEREFEIDVETQKNQAEIASALNKKTYLPDADVETKDTSLAMMLYIDLKEHPEGHKFAKEFTGKNQKIYEQSQSLSPKLQRIANKIIEQNRIAGELAVEQGVIKEARENYIAHLWERGPRRETFFARFRQKTARARQRQLEGGIAEGLSKGMKLRVQDVTLASQIAQSQVNQANVGKKLLKMGKDWGLLSHQQEAEDWVQVEHPGFTTYRYRGTVELGADKPRGANIYVTDEGVVMEKVPVYAEPELGKKLNKIFSPSVIWKIPGAELVTRYNAIIKSTILYTSLFHHQAFLRSYAFGSHGINPVEAFKKGKEAIMNMEPEVRLLVRNGLTLGRIQDYDPRMLEGEDTIWGKVFALTEPTEKVNEWLQNQRRRQERFLFNKLGPYLKVQASLLELRAGLERNRVAIQRGEMTADEVAESVATLMNNDFGGLHLGRMGRSNTIQHLMRLMLLAPDWTESNVRSMIDAFKKGETGYMHRMFWGRIAIKALGATVLFNLLMSAFDDEEFVERYRRAWKEGHLRWLDVDITPIYKALGGKTDSRKYFSLIGHFRDPVKFVSRPGRSLKHKGSVVSRMVFDFASGQDWAGRQYTTIGELLGISEKGKLQGRLVKWGRGKAQVLEPEQLPSWFIYEGRQMMPIPIQNIAAFIAGEAEAFDAITKSMGMMTATTYPEKSRSGRRTVTRRRSTRR